MDSIKRPGAVFKCGTARTYAELHDGLSDMIESGRLTAADIPDDYEWLVESLAYLANATPKE